MAKAKKAVDSKMSAANDKANGNGNGHKPEAKEKAPKVYVPGSDVAKVKRGFVVEFVKFVQKHGLATREQLEKQFNGRQFDGRKVDSARVVRYLTWCTVNEVLKAK